MTEQNPKDKADFTKEDWDDKQAYMPIKYMTISEIKKQFQSVLSPDQLRELDKYNKHARK